MGKSKHKKQANDGQKQEAVIKSLKQLLEKQQGQVKTLLQERAFLVHRINNQNASWKSDVRLFQDQVSELKRQLELSRLRNEFDVAKGNLLTGLSKRDAFVYKCRLDRDQSDLDDVKDSFDILCHRSSEREDFSGSLKAKDGRVSSPLETSKQCCNMLENEVATLKREYENLAVQKSSEVSALQTEVKFAWNQYNEMEDKYTSQMQIKNGEVNQANEKIMKLLATMEQIQSSNLEKDERVAILSTKINKLESDACQKDGEISKLSKELDILKSKSTAAMPTLKRCYREPSSSSAKGRMNSESSSLEKESSFAEMEATIGTLRAELNKFKAEADQKNGEIATLSRELNLLRSKGASETPVLNRCTSEASSLKLRCRGNGRTRGSAAPKAEASSAQPVSENGVRRSKRKHDVITIEETPKLFTSQFKIPKLKSQSPRVR